MNNESVSTNHPASPDASPDNRERRERVPSDASPDPRIPTGPAGPRTEAGKARSSQNAITHGLRATKLENAVAPEVRAQYEALRRQYIAEFRPKGAAENTILDMLIFAAWQLYKVRELELFAAIDLGSELAPSSFGRSLKLARYRASHDRLFSKSLNEIRKLQQERLILEAAESAALPVHIPPGVRLKPITAFLKTASLRHRTMAAKAVPFDPIADSPYIRQILRRS